MSVSVFQTDTDIIDDSSEFGASIEKSIVMKTTCFKQQNNTIEPPDPSVNNYRLSVIAFGCCFLWN